MTKIEQIIESSLVGMKRAKCLKRIGASLATIPLPLAVIKLVPDTTIQDLFPWFDRDLAVQVLIILVSLGVLLYITGVLLFSTGKGQLAKQISAGKDFVRINESQQQLIERLRTLGAQGSTTESFISKDTLTMLLNTNPDYVQAWGKRVLGNRGYTDVCFFVVAALNADGVKDMQPDSASFRKLKTNKDLKAEHLATRPKRCVGLYIIELFGQSKRSRGAASSKLFQYLNETFSSKMVDPSFKIFARPATTDGMRVTKHYSFTNLGKNETDMHVWQATDEAQDLCNTVLSIFSAK